MAFNLKTFRANVHSIGRSQYFQIRIPKSTLADVSTDELTALARSASVPQMNHDTGDVWYRGLAMKIDLRPTFDTWQVRFLGDENSSLRNRLLKWMEKAYNISTLRNLGHNDYKEDGISVSQLASDGTVTATYTFFGMWPTTVGAIEMSQENAAPVEFDATFTYDYFLQNSLQGDVTNSVIDIDVNGQGIQAGAPIF